MIATATQKHEDAAVALHYEITAIIREEVGVDEASASRLAEDITRGLRKRFTGQYLGEYYLAGGMTLRERSIRDKAIRTEFNGTNRAEVCAKYGISKARLYQIVGRNATCARGLKF